MRYALWMEASLARRMIWEERSSCLQRPLDRTNDGKYLRFLFSFISAYRDNRHYVLLVFGVNFDCIREESVSWKWKAVH